MRSEDVIILLAAGAMAFFIVKMAKGGQIAASAQTQSSLPAVLTTERITQFLDQLYERGYEYT